MKTRKACIRDLITGIATLWLSGQTANAATIIDTGTPPGPLEFWPLNPIQWQSAEFTTTSDWTITDIEGFISGGSFNGSSTVGTLTVALYNDGGDIPGIQRLAQAFSLSAITPGFHGVSGLSYFLPAGTYWVAFEVRAGQDFYGFIPGRSPFPLGNEALWNSSVAGYSPVFGSDIGILIQGIASVPLPAAAWFLGAGLLGIARLGRRRR